MLACDHGAIVMPGVHLTAFCVDSSSLYSKDTELSKGRERDEGGVTLTKRPDPSSYRGSRLTPRLGRASSLRAHMGPTCLQRHPQILEDSRQDLAKAPAFMKECVHSR